MSGTDATLLVRILVPLKCMNPAATGLALLAFLGAGYTHRDGKYAEVGQSRHLSLVADHANH